RQNSSGNRAKTGRFFGSTPTVEWIHETASNWRRVEPRGVVIIPLPRRGEQETPPRISSSSCVHHWRDRPGWMPSPGRSRSRRVELRVALGTAVLLRDIERHGPRPGLLDEVSHLVGVDRLEANGDPVEPHVARPRQLELVRIRLDGGLSHLLREPAAHALTVLGQREPHDLADPELDLAVHEHL